MEGKIVKAIKISLPSVDNDGLYAEIEIQRNGQISPQKGDDIVVIGRIKLPADHWGEVVKELRFGERCRLYGSELDYLWGRYCGEGFRCVEKEFHATKWREAEAQAEAWASGEIERLVSVLRVRWRALLAAEDY